MIRPPVSESGHVHLIRVIRIRSVLRLPRPTLITRSHQAGRLLGIERRESVCTLTTIALTAHPILPFNIRFCSGLIMAHCRGSIPGGGESSIPYGELTGAGWN